MTDVYKRWARRLGAMLVLFGLLAVPSKAQDLLAQFEEKTTTFTLDNGLTFVVVERHDAPVVSFHTLANVGSVNEPAGQTGIAHMFEHMAFKGTTSIGTENIEKEMAALQRMEEIYLQLRREREKVNSDSSRIAELEAQFQAAQDSAQSYVAGGEFEQILERNGVSGLNAYTSPDVTGYIYTLPANKLELFFALEADRFLNPVLREFYTERDVVMEERRQSESSPFGRLFEEMLATAFKAHPYGQPTIGHMSDIRSLSRTDAKRFYDEHYVASNLTLGIVGDVDPEQVRRYAEEYLGRLPEGDPPRPLTTEEPEQLGERRVVLRESSQPFVAVGYHRPSARHEDHAAYQVLSNVLSGGRTSRLYKAFQETQKALNAQAIPALPGSKYPSLFGVVLVPSRGESPDSLEQDLYDELDRIKENGITQAELERAKTNARASLIRQLDDNSGLARQLSTAEAIRGDWREVFRQIDRIEAVTASDVQRVAQETFQRSNRTVAMIKNVSSSQPTADAGN